MQSNRTIVFLVFVLLLLSAIGQIAVTQYKIYTAPIEITGIITDADGMPIPDAYIGGHTEEQESKDDGTYKIMAKRDDVLEFIYLGFITKKVPVEGRKRIDVKLEIDTAYINQYPVRKPVIYLYPETPTEVSLKVECSGKLLVTYPEYNAGWKVKAYPNGTLIDRDSKEYAYLFWEGSKKYKQSERQYTQGFVVAGDSTTAFLQEVLPKLGLKPKEYNDFIVYWLPLMKFNKWNFVHFRTGDTYDIISKNIVSPAPETNIRVFMEFKKIEKPFAVEPQSFETPTRKGFTLVEWGGTEMKETIRVNGDIKNL